MIKNLIPLQWRIRVRQYLNARANSSRSAYRRVSALGRSSPNAWIRKSSQIEGWLFEGEHEFLFSMALASPRGAFVEIGSLFGKSTCIISGAIQSRGNGEVLYAIDPFTVEGSPQDAATHQRTHKQTDTFSSFIKHAKALGFYDTIVPIASFSYKAIPSLAIGVSFAFIDGCHEKPAVEQDFELIEKLCVDGATVIFHDASASFPGVSAAIDQILHKYPHVVNLSSVGTMVAVRVNKTSSV